MQCSSFYKIPTAVFRDNWRNSFAIPRKSFLVLHINVDNQVGNHWFALAVSVAMDLAGLTICVATAFEAEVAIHFLELRRTILIQPAVVCTSPGSTLILRQSSGHSV